MGDFNYFDTNQEPEATATYFGSGTVDNAIKGQSAVNRAMMMHSALAEKSPGVESLRTNLENGQEDYLRQQAQTGFEEDRQKRLLRDIATGIGSGENTKDVLARMRALRQPVYVRPDTSMEKAFGDKYAQAIIERTSPRSQLSQSLIDSPEETKGAISGLQDIVSKRMILHKAADDADERRKGMNGLETVWQFSKGFIPGVTGTELSPNWNPANLAFSGSSLKAERDRFWAMSVDEGKDYIDMRMKDLMKSNPFAATTWIKAMMDLPGDEVMGMNLLSGVDSATVPGAISSLGKVALTLAGAKKLLRQSVSAIDRHGAVTPANMAAAAGDMNKAAELNAVEKVFPARSAKETFTHMDPIGAGDELVKEIPYFFNPSPYFNLGPGQLAREASQRMTNALRETSSKLMQGMSNVFRAPRVPEELIKPMLLEAEAITKINHPSIQNAIVDTIPIYQEGSNTLFANHIIGDIDGLPFKSAASAQQHLDKVYQLDYRAAVIRNVPIPAETSAKFTANAERKVQAEKNAAELAAKGPGDIHQDRIIGFASIKGKVRLEDGTEISVVNKKGAIYDAEGNKIDPNKVTAYRTPAKNTDWVSVNKPGEENVDALVNTLSKQGPLSATDFDSLQKGSLKTSPKQQEMDKIMGVSPAQKLIEDTTPKAVRELTDNGAAIVQQGDGWYISITKALDETDTTLRSGILTTNNTNPVRNGVASVFLNSITSAEGLLGTFQRVARHIVTHVPQELQRVMNDMSKQVGKLPKESREQLRRVLEVNKNSIDTSTGKRGLVYRTQEDLERAWLDTNKRLPTEQESLAYLYYHQLMDMDWVIRNYGVHRDLARQGVEQYMTKVGDKEAPFPGRLEKDGVPWDHVEDLGIAVVKNGRIDHYYKNSNMPDIVKLHLQQQHEAGNLRTITVANPADKPLGGIDWGTNGKKIGGTVNMVVTDNHTVRPLSMNLVDYTPGVHVTNPQPFFVKQALTAIAEKGLLRDYGAKTIFGADTPGEARRLGLALSELQKLFIAKKSDLEIQAFIEKNLPKDVDYWRNQFIEFNEKGGWLSLDQPIAAVPSGTDFFKANPHLRPEKLTSERNSQFNLFRSIDMDFMANRDGPLMQVANRGTLEKPIYEIEKARTLDPYVSISRALGNGVRNLITNDYKISAIEQWVAQYAHVLSNPDLARKNPFSAYYHMPFNDSVGEEFRNTLLSAKSTKARIDNFLGTHTEFGRELNWLQNKMLNSLSEPWAKAYNDHELKLLKDPIGFTRSWMFDFKFGFYNPAQFMVQGMGYTHVLAVAGPIHGEKAMAAYLLQKAMGLTEHPETLNRFANMAAKSGWKKEEFIESYQTMRNLGFDIVGKEHSMRDNAFDPNFLFFKGKGFLEWGRTPFIEGERLTRMTAWNAAYSEWRVANPTKEINNYSIGSILLRADDLSANMTKASHSALQEGVFSVPSQFYTFSHRMMEQFWGGRLSTSDKIRAFTTHSILFGLPVTAAIGIPWPLEDSLKQYMMETGSPLLDNGWYKGATEGFLNYAIWHMTGREYNPEKRYGPGFSDIFKKLIGNELSALEFFGGASGTFLKSIAQAVYPGWAHMRTAMFGGQESFPLTKDDILQVLREVATANNVHNAIMAVNTGKYFSKNGTFVQEGMDYKDGIAFMLGLTRRDIEDTRLKIGSMKDRADGQKRLMNLAEREFKRAFTYMGDGEYDKAEPYIARAKALMVAIGDFRDDQIQETMKRAFAENAPLSSKIMKDFADKGGKSELKNRFQRLFDGKP